MNRTACADVRGERIRRLRRWSANCSPIHSMKRALAKAHIAITIDDELEDTWIDEKTVRFDFDKPNLTAEDRLVIGYLTMEANGLFGHLSVEEQQQIANVL
ncbi:MAG TPA: hypothetical protein VF334_17200, partial [Polyangia bacterium]